MHDGVLPCKARDRARYGGRFRQTTKTKGPVAIGAGPFLIRSSTKPPQAAFDTSASLSISSVPIR